MEQMNNKYLNNTIIEKWGQTKRFCSNHKYEIAVGTLSAIIGFIGIKISGKGTLSSSDGDSNGTYSFQELISKSYDELEEIRENVRLDYQNDNRDFLLHMIDEALDKVGNPREAHARSLSNDELESELEAAKNLYYQEYEIDKRDKRSYEERRLDEVYKQHSIDYDNFYQLNCEKERRYAEQHPEKFPIHREHGWYLPEDDD